MTNDYRSVTEVAGRRATREQLMMIQTRYSLAAQQAAGKRVLEVACGPGRGLGLLARRARFTVGGDRTWSLVRDAAQHYRGRVPVLQFDAQALPFTSGSFDVIILFEAIYYLPDARRFVEESRRVLAAGGRLLICSANAEWPGYTSSPFVTRDYSATALAELLRRCGFDVTLSAGFDTVPHGSVARLVDALRRAAIGLRLIPGTLAARERLKRLFYGKLDVLGPEIDEDGHATAPLVPIDPRERVNRYKVLYAIGRLPCDEAHTAREGARA